MVHIKDKDWGTVSCLIFGQLMAFFMFYVRWLSFVQYMPCNFKDFLDFFFSVLQFDQLFFTRLLACWIDYLWIHRVVFFSLFIPWWLELFMVYCFLIVCVHISETASHYMPVSLCQIYIAQMNLIWNILLFLWSFTYSIFICCNVF